MTAIETCARCGKDRAKCKHPIEPTPASKPRGFLEGVVRQLEAAVEAASNEVLEQARAIADAAFAYADARTKVLEADAAARILGRPVNVDAADDAALRLLDLVQQLPELKPLVAAALNSRASSRVPLTHALDARGAIPVTPDPEVRSIAPAGPSYTRIRAACAKRPLLIAGGLTVKRETLLWLRNRAGEDTLWTPLERGLENKKLADIESIIANGVAGVVILAGSGLTKLWAVQRIANAAMRAGVRYVNANDVGQAAFQDALGQLEDLLENPIAAPTAVVR